MLYYYFYTFVHILDALWIIGQGKHDIYWYHHIMCDYWKYPLLCQLKKKS